MKTNSDIHLSDVQNVYSGPEGRLWELIMGRQIHIGGFVSSNDLAAKAGIRPGTSGVDFCCCNGAGMRFLVLCRGVASMTGVDATRAVLDHCHSLCREEGLEDRIICVQADVCETGLPADSFDFVWGEDAWCYVEDKSALIRQAARIIKPGGVIAFTDWLEGPSGFSGDAAKRLLSFMKFPSIQDTNGYVRLLQANGLTVCRAEDTGRFAPYMDLYLDMVTKQLTFDVLKIIGYDQALLGAIHDEMCFMRDLAHEGKLIQGLFVAQK
jgi:SAM-dependent methyltransferase